MIDTVILLVVNVIQFCALVLLANANLSLRRKNISQRQEVKRLYARVYGAK